MKEKGAGFHEKCLFLNEPLYGTSISSPFCPQIVDLSPKSSFVYQQIVLPRSVIGI